MTTPYAFAGSRYEVGEQYGRALRPSIAHNLDNFRRAAEWAGLALPELARAAMESVDDLTEQRQAELHGLARGADRPYQEVLTYNLMYGRVFPDECTTMIALSDATASGRTIVMKNSDKIGRDDMVGPGFHQHKEINVVLALRPDDGPAMIGVSAAGSTGMKMGLNDRGVAGACNISRTFDLQERQAATPAIRALDRIQLVRNGLDQATARAAALTVIPRLAAQPMNTPGNLQFVDAREAVLIEGAYDRLASQWVSRGVASRANSFVLLEEINHPDDASSRYRYARTQELLNEYRGRITVDHMIAFSQDHAHGPGPNSICRHGSHYEEETSQSSMVMEIDPDRPEGSRVAIALGKPCHAWRHPEGRVCVHLSFQPEEIPAAFVAGESWRRFITEEPNPDHAEVAELVGRAPRG